MIFRNLHWSQARFAIEPDVLLRVRIAPGWFGFALAGDPELVVSMTESIHQSDEMGAILQSGEKK